MHNLQFAKLKAVQHELDWYAKEYGENHLNRLLGDLVIIFTQSDGNQFLWVYNREAPPMPPPSRPWRVRSLDALRRTDYATYDGLVIGYSAIDVLLPNIATHGDDFYPLGELLASRGQADIMLETRKRLAHTVWEHLAALNRIESNRIDHRARVKVLELGIPGILGEKPLDHLVALLVHHEDLGRFLDDDPSVYTLVYNDPDNPERDLASLSAHSNCCEWVVTFDELGLFDERLQHNRQFLSLRQTLRALGRLDILSDTCRGLAYRCWKEYQASGQTRFRDAAYLLGLELHLRREDPEDLVAVLPHRDFETFVEQGNALRVYRVRRARPPSLAAATQGICSSVDDLLFGKQINTADYTTVPISFTALQPLFKPTSEEPILDLGITLWKADQVTVLARTLWLFSRDLLKRADWVRIRGQLSNITDLAIRSGLLYSLGNPWAWRQGRYNLFLRDCYRHIIECFSNQSRQATPHSMVLFYRALSIWYGCYTSEDVLANLEEMVRTCDAFLEISSERDDSSEQRSIILHLHEIGRRILQDTTRQDDPEQHEQTAPTHLGSLGVYLRDIVDSNVTIGDRAPSVLFDDLFKTYTELHTRWQSQRDARVYRESNHQDSLEQLDVLQDQYRDFQRAIYAPAHEARLLDHICNDDYERLKRFRRGVAVGAVLQITLRNMSVLLQMDETIIFDVENVGIEPASSLNIQLDQSTDFDLLEILSATHIQILEPGQRLSVRYRIRAKNPEITFSLSYSYRDLNNERQSDQRIIHPVARRLIAGNKPLGNPYTTARPVYGFRRFFGRKLELEIILNRLFASGTTDPILIRGPRRMGKTSLMREIQLILTNEFERRRLDLDLSPELESYLNNVHPVFASLQSAETKDQTVDTRRFLYNILADAFKSLQLSQERTDQLLATYSAYQGDSSVAFVRAVDSVLEEYPNLRLLLLLDEYDESYHGSYSDLNRNLRFISQREQRITWVTSSTWSLAEQALQPGSPLFAQLKPIELVEMSWDAASQLVTDLGEQVGVNWENTAVTTLLDQTGRRPMLTQLLCSQIIDHLIKQSTNVVDSSIVATAINQFLTRERPSEHVFAFTWYKRLESFTDIIGKLILATINQHMADYNAPPTYTDIIRAIVSRLEKHGIELPDLDERIEKQLVWLRLIADVITQQGITFQFSYPLIERWMQQVIAEESDLIESELRDWESD